MLLPAHRTYLKIDLCASSALINFVLNGAIGWGLYRSLASVPLWGAQSIAGDTVASAFILSFLSCLIITPGVRQQIQRGRFPILQPIHRLPAWADHILHSALLRSLLVAMLATLVFGYGMVGLLSLTGVASFSLWGFVAFKALFTAGMAALLAPLVGWWAMSA